jgi:hypothetical protein
LSSIYRIITVKKLYKIEDGEAYNKKNFSVRKKIYKKIIKHTNDKGREEYKCTEEVFE